MASVEEITKGYLQLPSGYWQRLSDGSSPYLFNGEEMIFFTGTGSGGGGVAPEVDVLSTVIPKFTDNTDPPKDGDELQDVLNKFYTFDRALPTEVRQVNLTGIVFSVSSKVVPHDTIVGAIGKLQAHDDEVVSKAGKAGGFVKLDSDGKIPVSHLPSSVFRFMGHYDVATNTPELKDNDSSLQGGEVYQCSTAGAFNDINLAVGDLIVYEYATKKWVKSLASGEVITVNNMTGNVALNGGNIQVGIVDTRTIQEALESVAPKVKSIINLNEDKASGHIEFAGIRWGYERTNPASGRQFFQAVGESVPIAYMQKAFYDAGIEMQKNTSAVATSTKTFYDTLALTEMKEWCVVHILIYHELWRVNQLVVGTTEQKLIIWAEQVV